MNAPDVIERGMHSVLGDRHGHWSYLDKEIYADQIERYFRYFRRNQITIARSEDLLDNVQTTLKTVVSFLRLPDRQVAVAGRYNTGSYRPIDDDLRREVREHFTSHNQRLYDLLGVESAWW